MEITEVQVWDFSPEFRDGPFVMSHVTQDVAHGRILRVESAGGLQGLGEVVFAPSVSLEDRRQRIVDEPDTFRPLIGRDLEAVDALCQGLRTRGKSWRGVAFGLETAAFDLRARAQDRAVADLLGGAKADAVADYFSISERAPGGVLRRIAAAGPDRAVIQLKVGIASNADDRAQIAAVLEALGDQQTLLADANGGWSVDEALGVIGRFDDPRLMWEEPCRSYEDNIAVATATQGPVMLDQCVGDAAAAMRALEDGRAAALCIKPAFLGGLAAAREIRDRCADVGHKMRIDGPWCGDIAVAAILNLAIGAPPDLLIAGCDLREPLVIEPDLNGAVACPGARTAPPPGPGLGIDPALRELGPPDAVYR